MKGKLYSKTRTGQVYQTDAQFAEQCREQRRLDQIREQAERKIELDALKELLAELNDIPRRPHRFGTVKEWKKKYGHILSKLGIGTVD